MARGTLVIIVILITKIKIIQVIWKRLYKATSESDHGTLYQLRNLLQRRNVGKKPKKGFNAHHDFFNVVLTSHILAAAMEMFGMDNLEDEPCEGLVPLGIDTMPKEEREEVLQYLVGLIVDSYIDINHCLSDGDCGPNNSKSDVNGEVSENDYEDDNSVEVSDSEEDESEDDETSKDAMEVSKTKEQDKLKRTKDKDYVKVYAEEMLTLGMIYSEYSDAIKEGDGLRVMRCWKFLLIIFKAAQRKNYACEAFNFLAQEKFILSPRLSQQLIWSRFVNTHGGMGRNIPADLRMEHLNRILKDGVKGLGANKTDRAIARLGKCIDSIDQVLNNFDEHHSVRSTSDYHTTASLEKDIGIIVEELSKNVHPFTYSKGRSHKKIKVTKYLMKTLDDTAFQSWMDEKWKMLLAGLL
jgi:hypothetical protein